MMETSIYKGANMSNEERKAAIEKKIKQLKAQHSKLIARDSEKERASRTRKAVIIGTWVMANDPALVSKIVAGLTRDQDKLAFGVGIDAEGMKRSATDPAP
jgi:hypothetical protein